MYKNIPITPAYENLTDAELLHAFLQEPPARKAMYYGVLASRLPRFKDVLFKEAICPENRSTDFYAFIKIAWLVVIAVLEYSEDDDFKREIAETIKQHWTETEYDDFINYIKDNPGFMPYFRYY